MNKRVFLGFAVSAMLVFAGSHRAQAADETVTTPAPPANVNVWTNALFVGDGAANGAVKGNFCAYGSVHVLGANLAVGMPAIEDAIDLSGFSLMRNNYESLPAYLRTRVPALPIVGLDGTLSETLDAKLRVKKGLVSMNGNSSIGTPYTAGSSGKQQVDGTYVTEGWGGKKATPDGGRGIPTDVYSDNGWSELYDCGDLVKFPLLSDPWRDPVTGVTVPKPGAGRAYTHEEYFSEVLVANPNIPTDGIYAGDIILDASAPDAKGAVYWNATTNTYLTGAAAVVATPGAADDYFKFVPSKKLLEFPQKTAGPPLNDAAQIRINGTLTFMGAGVADTISYFGRCAFLTTGDVNIDVKLLSCNYGLVGDFVKSFPNKNCLGIMTKTNINLGLGNGASQLDLLGAFYAQGTVTSLKQTNVMGTMVATLFDITKNVLLVYQVPDLAIYLPAGMIGNFPVLLYPVPSHVTATAIGTDSITWNWQDNTSDETGFIVWCAAGTNPQISLPITLPANTVSWQITSLTPNMLYTFEVAATNPSYDTTRSAPVSAWTLATTPTAPVVGGATVNSLTVSIDPADGNPAGTEYALKCITAGRWVQADGTLGFARAWKTAAAWGAATVSGLAEYTPYRFSAVARNGAAVLTPGGATGYGITRDGTAPTGTIVINGNAPVTANASVSLSLTWADGTGSGVSRMRFSDDGAHWTPWEPVATPRASLLPGPNGYNTVRVQYMDRAGNASARFSDYILLNAR